MLVSAIAVTSVSTACRAVGARAPPRGVGLRSAGEAAAARGRGDPVGGGLGQLRAAVGMGGGSRALGREVAELVGVDEYGGEYAGFDEEEDAFEDGRGRGRGRGGRGRFDSYDEFDDDEDYDDDGGDYDSAYGEEDESGFDSEYSGSPGGRGRGGRHHRRGRGGSSRDYALSRAGAALSGRFRRLLHRLRHRFARARERGYIPARPEVLFADHDMDDDGTVRPRVFLRLVRGRMRALGVRHGDGLLLVKELRRAASVRAYLGEGGEEEEVDGRKGGARRPRIAGRDAPVDYLLFCQLLVSGEDEAKGLALAARVRAGLGDPRLEQGEVLRTLARFDTASDPRVQQQQKQQQGGARGLGRILVSELAAALAVLGVPMTPADCSLMLAAVGCFVDGSGRVDYSMFLRVVLGGDQARAAGVRLVSPAEQMLRARLRESSWAQGHADLVVHAAFRQLDPTGKGWFSRSELGRAVRRLGVEMTQTDVDRLAARLAMQAKERGWPGIDDDEDQDQDGGPGGDRSAGLRRLRHGGGRRE